MKALSVRAPWWWYIVRGYKDIENRDWYSGYRGEAGIHASKWWNTRGFFETPWTSAGER